MAKASYISVVVVVVAVCIPINAINRLVLFRFVDFCQSILGGKGPEKQAPKAQTLTA